MFKIFNRGLSIFTDGIFAALKVNNIDVINSDGSVNGSHSVAVKTNGTTAVNVFGSAGAPTALTVTSVVSVAEDTTAGNITLKQGANTVVTIAKGTSSGALVGGVALANTVYAKGDACTVVSSSAGNSIVVINYTI